MAGRSVQKADEQTIQSRHTRVELHFFVYLPVRPRNCSRRLLNWLLIRCLASARAGAFSTSHLQVAQQYISGLVETRISAKRDTNLYQAWSTLFIVLGIKYAAAPMPVATGNRERRRKPRDRERMEPPRKAMATLNPFWGVISCLSTTEATRAASGCEERQRSASCSLGFELSRSESTRTFQLALLLHPRSSGAVGLRAEGSCGFVDG